MSYAIIRNENHKVGAVPLLERHNERKNKNYSNTDIDKERTKDNYHLKAPNGSYWETFNKIKDRQQLKGNLRLQGEKQSTVLCEFVITSDKEFFDKLGAERTKRFFEDAYDFVTAKVGGEQYIVSAVVHMDEATPHMHVSFIPTVTGKDRKGQPCQRINCSEFWKGRDSYSRLQDEWYDWIAHTKGYDLERGTKGSTAEHLSVTEYKLKKTNEQLEEAKRQMQDIAEIESISGSRLPFGMVGVKKEEFEELKKSAKALVVSRDTAAENEELKEKLDTVKNENAILRKENASLNDKLMTVNEEFERFYNDVADERALKRENERLTVELSHIGSQVHELQRELSKARTANEMLSGENTFLSEKIEEQQRDIADKDKEIIRLNGELTMLQKLNRELQIKWDTVMRFIEEQKLAEKWRQFIEPVKRRLGR